MPPPATHTTFLTGADISWVTEMEDAGLIFYSRENQAKDLFALLRDYEMQIIRLRVWVHPAEKYNGLADVLEKAQRAQEAGYKIMIDFHYSDFWADPGKQTKPALWADADLSALRDSVTAHTTHVLQTLASSGIHIQYVQTGNEINDGLLWPDGRATNSFSNLVSLTNAGYAAAKSIYPNAKVIIHLSNGENLDLFTWFFENFFQTGGKCDIIGMSLYPDSNNWESMIEKFTFSMKNVLAIYHRPVFLVEFGMPHDAPTDCYYALKKLISLGNTMKNQFLGLLYWEPECPPGWNGYNKGAFDTYGRPSAAMEAFK